jgi:hypothetical protein
MGDLEKVMNGTRRFKAIVDGVTIGNMYRIENGQFVVSNWTSEKRHWFNDFDKAMIALRKMCNGGYVDAYEI